MEPALSLPHQYSIRSSTHDLGPVLRPITDGLAELDGVTTAAIWLRSSADGSRLHIGATSGPFVARADEWEFVRGALESRRSFLLGGVTAVFPLMARDEVMGVLAVLYRRPISTGEFGYLS